MPISLVCVACSASHRFEQLLTGRAVACPSCGGRLALPAPAVFRCRGCGISSKPAMVDVAKHRACPKCGQALEVVAAPGCDPAQTLGTISLPTIAVGDSAHGSPSRQPATAGDAPFDPARVEFVSGNPATDEAPPAPAGRPGAPPVRRPAARGGLAASSFGKYQILRELARGGMGIVYEARDPGLRRTVALKVLISGEAATPEAIHRFIREARAASALRHPNIIAVHDSGEVDGQHYFTMDFIAGRELGAELKSGERTLEVMLGWVRTACGALEHAHRKGVIHRDLKPANIMIDAEGRPIVMDFGLARDQTTYTQLSMSGTVMGTPAYMSPEQALGHARQIDHRSDIYSMGVIIYELATGATPFHGDTLFETMRAVVNDDPRPPRELKPDIGGDLSTIILTCLQKRPELRYQSMQALADDLGRYLSGEPIRVRPPSLITVALARARRRPLMAAAVVGAPLAVLIGVVLALALMGDDFLGRMQKELDAHDPQRAAAAITAIGGQLGEHAVRAGSSHERALRMVRSVIGGDAPAAEAAALPIVVQEEDAAAVPLLVALAADRSRSDERRVRALDVLGKLHALAPDPQQEQRQLVEILHGDGLTAPILAHAAAALRSLDAGAVFPALGPIAIDQRQPAALRVAAIVSIGADLSLHAPGVMTIMRLAGDRDEAVANAAESALASARSRPSIFSLYGLQDRVGAAAGAVAGMERAVAAEQGRLEDELKAQDDDPGGVAKASPIQAVAAHLLAQDPSERLAAAFDLGQLQDPQAIAPLLERVGDPDHDVRRAVARALVKLAPKAPIPSQRLLGVLRAADARIREDAALALGELEAREAVPALAAALGSEPDPAAGAAMAASLGRIGDPAAIAALARAAAGEAEDVAIAAVDALGRHHAFHGQSLSALAAALASRSRMVRELAGTTLHQATGEDFALDQARWQAWIAAHAH